MNKEKEKSVRSEISKLKSSLSALERTICSIKEDVKSRVSDEKYGVWLKRLNSVSGRFKTMFSDINNDQYNHWYKMSKKTANVWDNISYDVKWMKDNVCDLYVDSGNDLDVSKIVDGFEEGDLSSMFNENSVAAPLVKIKKDSVLTPLVEAKIRAKDTNSSMFTENSVPTPLVKIKKDSVFTPMVETKRKAKDENSKHGTVTKKLKGKENRKEIHQDNQSKDNDLENVSDNELFEEDESSIINGFVLVDEVGETDLSNFEEMIARITQ